jgi:uncharacterized integral membrane protein
VRSPEPVVGQNDDVAKRSERVEPSGERPLDRRQQFRLITIAVVATLLLWFAVENFQDVSIHFWVTTRQAPLIVVVLISGLLGALIAVLVMRRRPKSKDHTGGPPGRG